MYGYVLMSCTSTSNKGFSAIKKATLLRVPTRCFNMLSERVVQVKMALNMRRLK